MPQLMDSRILLFFKNRNHFHTVTFCFLFVNLVLVSMSFILHWFILVMCFSVLFSHCLITFRVYIMWLVHVYLCSLCYIVLCNLLLGESVWCQSTRLCSCFCSSHVFSYVFCYQINKLTSWEYVTESQIKNNGTWGV